MNQVKNSVRLIGNLGMNPEVKEVKNGRMMAKFSLATSENYRDENGNKVTETQWHSLIAWGKQAELVSKFLKKGSEVAIEGKITNNSFTDKEGNKRYNTQVVINDLMMLGGKKN